MGGAYGRCLHQVQILALVFNSEASEGHFKAKKVAKHKVASMFLTIGDTVISPNFLPPGYVSDILFKNGGHFEYLPKVAKHKIASISITVGD